MTIYYDRIEKMAADLVTASGEERKAIEIRNIEELEKMPDNPFERSTIKAIYKSAIKRAAGAV